MLSSDVVLPGRSVALAPEEESRADEVSGVEAIFDSVLVALISGVITYGICEAISRWRWWAVAVWIATSLSIPVVLVVAQSTVEFLQRREK